MNDQDRRELEEISAYQRQLREYLGVLDQRIGELKKRIAESSRAVPPPLPEEAQSPIPKPADIPKPSKPAEIPRPAPAPVETQAVLEKTAPQRAGFEEAPAPEPAESETFEMRFGTYWLVRIGVVLMLTSAVFFGRQYFGQLGAAGKVAVLYLASAATLGLGFWLERIRETLRNFARVLMAGGFAAVYYTTYAAGHVEGLKIIHSELVAGILLMGWAGVMVAVADWKKSQTLALFAVLLAYYTSAITEVGYFTLFSNLILTAAAVFFLVRHRWAGLTVASLIATYLGYAFWRFYHDGQWILQMSAQDFWIGTGFLAGYWILFTSAVFLSRHEGFTGATKGMFLTLNNGALFTLILMTLPQVYPDSFWKFCMIFGGVLLALALAARISLRDEPVRNSYAAQGLLLITLGIMSYYTGKTLALVLSAETVALIVAGYQLNSRMMRAAAYALAPFALCFGLSTMKGHETESMWMGIAMGAAFVFNGWWVKRRTLEPGAIEFQPKPAYFAFLGIFLWAVTTNSNASQLWLGPLFALEAVVLTFSIYALRMPELSILAQFLLLIAQMIVAAKLDARILPWWNPLITLGATLGLSHWWQRQQILLPGKRSDHFFPAVYALGAISIIYLWASPQFDAEQWTIVSSLLSIALLAYGAATRAWYLAALGQFFLAVSAVRFCGMLWDGHPTWWAMLVPIAVIMGTGLVARAVIRDPAREARDCDSTVLAFSRLYSWIAFVMAVFWVFEYVPRHEQFWTFSVVAFVLHLWGARAQNGARLGISAAFNAIALFIFFTYSRADAVYLLNLLACLLLLVQQQISRKLLPSPLVPSAAHGAMIVAGLVALWVYVSCWVLTAYKGFAVTGSWALLALAGFLAGFMLKERAYRLTSLVILGFALVKIFAYDIWEIEEFYRWITAFIVGAVCIGVGFIYTRYSDKIKSWL